jgi:esterase/lipase superfamily enzyme
MEMTEFDQSRLLDAIQQELNALIPADEFQELLSSLEWVIAGTGQVISALLAVVPLNRLARDIAVTIYLRDQRHLADFMSLHCPTDEVVIARGARLAASLADLHHPPMRPTTRGATYFSFTSNLLVGDDDDREQPPETDHVAIDVHFATNRKCEDDATKPSSYRAERGDITYGRAKVSIPRNHKMGRLEEPKWWKLEFRPNPDKHVILKSVQPSDAQAFFASAEAQAAKGGGQALVFIHGFNVGFDEALRRTGQLAFDLNFQGVPILFSWPSNGQLQAYAGDGANEEASRPHLADFLESLVAQGGIEVVHLIAHSMGNRALLYALERLTANGSSALFGQCVMAAPDVDVDVFHDLIKRGRSRVCRATLYASSTDLALEASKRLHQYPRAGDAGDGLVVGPYLETVDATNVSIDFLGHGYYGDSRSVICDLFALLRGSPPSGRPGLTQKLFGGLPYWAFKP